MVEFEPKAEKVDKGATVLPRDEYRSEKMRKCLKNTLLVIGVYAPEDFLAGKGQGALSLVENIVRGRSQPRRLVGFGRAIGDASLVATLHDIMVDPEYRGYGIGRRILLQLANQVRSD
jgi:GNAT superfamily N-acetyltransferase